MILRDIKHICIQGHLKHFQGCAILTDFFPVAQEGTDIAI